MFEERIEEAFPERAKRIRNGILEVRGGKMNESAFGSRRAWPTGSTGGSQRPTQAL